MKNNHRIRWNTKRHDENVASKDADDIKALCTKSWEEFESTVKKLAHPTRKRILELLDEHRDKITGLCKGNPELEDYLGYSLNLINEKRDVLLMDPSEMADRIMGENSFRQILPDGAMSEEKFGFTNRGELLAVPAMGNCDAPDFVGFALHGNIILAIYSPGERENLIKPVGWIEHPQKVPLPQANVLFNEYKKLGLLKEAIEQFEEYAKN